MKGVLAIGGFFAAGIVVGHVWGPTAGEVKALHSAALWVLYGLMLQVGISVGASPQLRQALRGFTPRLLLLPLATIGGTLAVSALLALLLRQWSAFEVMAVGSGMGYYSLSSVLILQLKAPSLGVALATELSTIALLSNIVRELLALAGAPLWRRWCGRLAPVAVAGVTSVDVALPTILRVCGPQAAAVAVFHGIVVDLSVPFFVTLFCQL